VSRTSACIFISIQVVLPSTNNYLDTKSLNQRHDYSELLSMLVRDACLIIIIGQLSSYEDTCNHCITMQLIDIGLLCSRIPSI